jgi:2-oxoglutarate ferredoxin oxidoreductase subunit gamma
MQHKIIISGFGGQGVVSAGRILAYCGMIEDKKVSCLPSYGPEMRGGTANCHVIVSDDEIGSPVLNSATVLIAMNNPSLEKFEKVVEEGGIIIADSSLVDKKPSRKDIKACYVPATNKAFEMGNAAFANIILLGKLIGETGIVSEDNFENALYKILSQNKHHLIPAEMEALKYGVEYKE